MAASGDRRRRERSPRDAGATTLRYRAAVHELSICTSLQSIVVDHAAGRPVRTVYLDIGQLRQVIPETLAYSWDIVVADSPLAGSSLVINHIPATLRCRTCGETTTIDVPVFRCPCGSTETDLTAGRELQVTSLEVADLPTDTPSPT